MDKNKTIIIIPCYNEAGNIEKVIDEISRDLPDFDILIVDDNSADNTRNVVKNKGIRVVSHPYNMGYSAALLTGLEYAMIKSYDNAVLFDGDGQHIASEVNKLFDKRKETNSDIVIGSRFLNKSDYNHGFFRTLGTNLFSQLIRLFTGEKISDPTSGFQLLNRSIILNYANMKGFPEYPDANLLIYIIKKGCTVSEAPVKMREREDGQSMHAGIWNPIRYMFMMMYSLLLAAIFTRQNKDKRK